MKKKLGKARICWLLVIALVVTSFPSYVFGYANTEDTTQSASASADSVIKYDPNYKGTIEIANEVIGKRGEFEKHFVNTDGSMTAVSYPQKVHYKDENGQWQDIDSRLVIKDKEKGLYGPASSDLNVSLPGAATADILVSAKDPSKSSIVKLSSSYLSKVTDGDYSISWNILDNSANYTSDYLSKATSKTLDKSQIPSSALVKDAQPDISKLSHDEQMTALPNLDSTASYKNVIKNVDVDVTVAPDKLKENLIINSPKGFTSISYLINAGDLVGTVTDGNSVTFSNEKGDVVFTIPRPYMFDSKTLPDDSIDIKLNLVKTNDGYLLTMTPDTKWMNDPSRVYPVTIDPTVTTTRSDTNIKDTYIHSGDSAGDHYLSAPIKIGETEGASCRGYINFVSKPSINTTLNDITSANLIGYLYSGTSTYHKMRVYQPLTSWSASTITWANRPSNSSMITEQNAVLSGSYYKYTFPVTDSVKTWYSTGVNRGYMIKYSDETINDYNYFYSSDHPSISTSYYPCLSITYTPDTTSPVISSFTTTPATSSTAYTTDNTPTLNWTITENHLQEVQYAIGSGSYTKISTSKTGSYTIPTGKITTSGTYAIKIRALDASGNYGTISTKNYYFDITAPAKTTTPPNGEPQVKFTASGTNIIVAIWMSDAQSGLLNYKIGSTGTLTSITTNPYKITYTVPASDPIRTIYVYDKVGKVYTETIDPGDMYAPYAPSVIQSGNGVEIVDNGDRRNAAGDYRDTNGDLCLSNKIFYKVNGGAYVTLTPENSSETGRYIIDPELDRNIDNTIVVKAQDTYGNECAETTYTLPKEIGNYTETMADINYDQLAEPLSITRSYNSNTDKWYFSFDSNIQTGSTDRILTLTKQDGVKESFVYDEDQDKYIGADSGTELTLSGGYYCLDIGDYYFKYRVSDGKLYAIYLNSLSTTPIAQYAYDTSGIHITIGSHAININAAKTAVEVKKGTETLQTASYVFIANQLASVTDPMGRTTAFAYANNKLIQKTLSDGSNTYTMQTVSYGTTGQVSGVTYRNGSNVAYTYEKITDTSSDYNGSTKVTAAYSDDTSKVQYIYNDLSVVDADEINGDNQTAEDGSTIVETLTDENGNTIRELTSEGTYYYYAYDANNNQTVVAILRNQDIDPPATYDPANQSIYDEITLTAFNGEGQVTQEIAKKKISGTLTQISQTDYTYDSWGRNATRTDTSQSGVVTVTEYTYNGFGLVTQEETTVGSQTPKITTYVYDQNGQMLRQNQDGKITRNLYDSFGRISKEISPKYFVVANDSITINSENMASSSGTYSGVDNTTRYTYNNTTWNLTSMTDQYGTTTAYTYDTEGNLTRQDFDLYTVDQNVSGDITNVKVGSQNLATYSYNAGKLSTKTYGNNQSISYTYSGDNIASISYGSTLAYTFNYNSDGTLDSKVDYINNTTTNYDGNEIDVYITGDDSPIYSYTNENGYESNGAAVTTLTEKNGADTYITKNYDTYDVFGKENGTTSLYKTYSKTDGRIDSTSVKLNSQNGTNLLTTHFTYTGDNVTQVANTIGAVSKNFSYEYDSEDRISKVSCGNDDVNYYYDSKDQLIRANDEILGKTFTYTYNTRGNLTSKATYNYTTADPISGTPLSTDSYSYGDSNWPDKLTSYNGQAITYDAIGNPLSYKGYTMTWSAGRMLDSMIGNSKTLYFKYDDEGIRTQKFDGTVTTKYTTIDGRITSQKDGTNSLYFHYDQNNELTGVMINGTEYLYVRNLQGDIVSLVDTSGNVVVNYTYDAWGKVQSITGSLASTVGAINPMRYRGYYQDTETGLYYLQSRYYDPDTCRMVNADDPTTTQFVQGALMSRSLFTYCNNNSINLIDSAGYLGKHFWNTTWFVARVLDVIFLVITAGKSYFTAKALLKLIKANKKRIMRAVYGQIKKLGWKLGGNTLGFLLDLAGTVSGMSLGQAITWAWDNYLDGWLGYTRNNKYLLN